MYFAYVKFLVIYFYRYLLGKISNFLVYIHFHLTPQRSTDDSMREMILEQVRFYQRKIEQKRWTLWTKLIGLGKIIGINSFPPEVNPIHEVNDE